MKKQLTTARKAPLLLRPGSAIFNLVTGTIIQSFRRINRPGARMLKSKSRIAQAFGAFWLGMFGVLLPILILKMAAGALIMHDPFFAWRH